MKKDMLKLAPLAASLVETMIASGLNPEEACVVLGITLKFVAALNAEMSKSPLDVATARVRKAMEAGFAIDGVTAVSVTKAQYEAMTGQAPGEGLSCTLVPMPGTSH